MLFSKMEENYFLIIKVLCLLFKKIQTTIGKKMKKLKIITILIN